MFNRRAPVALAGDSQRAETTFASLRGSHAFASIASRYRGISASNAHVLFAMHREANARAGDFVPTPLADGWFDVGSASTLARVDSRLAVCVANRHLALLRTRTGLHAIDATCYHMGGPLLRAAVEDIEDCEALLCPYHHYHIALDTGERIYRDLHGATQRIKNKQRVHDVRETTEGRIEVRLRLQGSFESDRYAEKAPPPCVSTVLGAPRSGEVFLRASRAAPFGEHSSDKGAHAVNSLVKSMVVQSMRGGDGKAPWAAASSANAASVRVGPGSVRHVRGKNVSFGGVKGDVESDEDAGHGDCDGDADG